MLVDGYAGRALASLDGATQGQQLKIAESGSGAFVLNDTTGEARAIDAVELRLGTPFVLSALGGGRALSGVGQAGLVVVNPDDGEANVVHAEGEPIPFAVRSGTVTQVASDGSVWSLVDGNLVRTTSLNAEVEQLALDAPARLSLVGSVPLVVDVSNRRARLGQGSWQTLPTDADPSEILVQVPGPSAPCGWVGASDDLWCVSRTGLDESTTVAGLGMGGADFLAIAGDAAALVRRGPSSIVRFDWRTGRILDRTGDLSPSVASDATLSVSATTDLVWVDDVTGDIVWAVNPWGIRTIDKNALGILVLGEDGDVVESGEPGQGTTATSDGGTREAEERELDNNGIDDPPVAVDDAVTARSGASVTIQVTANDYDPDGEAIAVSSVGVPGHGSVDIGTASTVVYTPEPGYVGIDRFEYTIVDGSGNTASASVNIELLAPGSTNKAPVGVTDTAQTGAGVPVVIDVLLNDVDPERDALRLGGFSPPQGVGQATLGEVTETVGPSGLPALRFAPTEGFEGTAIFTYRPIDALDALGEDVEVRVEVARAGDPNRAPRVRPDAVRLRRDVPTPVLVLVNDSDPDGDLLTLSVVEPLPAGIQVGVEGEQLSVTACGRRIVVAVRIRGRRRQRTCGSWCGAGGGDRRRRSQPPPIVTADTDKVVIGQSVIIDVVKNDVDPDGDPLTVVSVTQPADGAGQATVFNREKIQFSPAPLVDEEAQSTARFTYTVTDGHGHEVVGEVTVTVLPEQLGAPPYARDDSTFTFVDLPVTVDVLRNDGDPSGGRPTIVGRPGCPSGGQATVTADNQVRFDPPRGRSGAFRCTYEVINDLGLKARASIIVSVREPAVTNLPPVVTNDTLTVEVGKTGSVDVVANDRDPDGGPNARLELVSSTAPVLGTATRSGNVITFVAGTQTGNATINYQVADAQGAVSLGWLRITITERANQPPIAVADTGSIFAPGTPQQFNVLINDSDPDETAGGLSVVSAARVSGDAIVSLSGSVVTVSPAPNFIGQIVATYTIRDGGGLTATSSIVLTVQKQPNRPPDAVDDSGEVVNGGSITVPVLFNDTDPDGDPLSVTIISGADGSLGSTSLTSNRSISFAATPGASGTAVIIYQVSDGELTDTATLRIIVRPCSESTPVATDGFLTTGYQQPIAVDLAAFGSNGSIVDVKGPPGYANGLYTPPAGENGNVVISYSVVNSCRLRASGRVTIDVNQVPVGSAKSVNMFRGDQVVLLVTDLATDAEALTITATAGAPSWVVTEPGRLVLSPPVGTAPGPLGLTATVADPGGLSTTVSVTVTIENRAPVAAPDTVDVSNGAPGRFDLVANDSDGDSGGGLIISELLPTSLSFSGGGTGSVTVQDDNRSVSVDPGDGRGVATFSYRVRDIDGANSAPATVTVTGPRINLPPIASDQSITVTVGTSAVIDLQASDPDGPPPSIVDATFSDVASIVTSRSGLTLSILVSTPGTYVVTYQVTDGEFTSSPATLTIVASSPIITTTTTPTITDPPTTTTP